MWLLHVLYTESKLYWPEGGSIVLKYQEITVLQGKLFHSSDVFLKPDMVQKAKSCDLNL